MAGPGAADPLQASGQPEMATRAARLARSRGAWYHAGRPGTGQAADPARTVRDPWNPALPDAQLRQSPVYRLRRARARTRCRRRAPGGIVTMGPGLARAAPFAAFVILLAVEPVLGGWVDPVMDPRWLYGIRSAVAGLLLLALWRRYAELRTAPEGDRGATWALATVTGVAVFALWIALDVPPLVFGEATPYDPWVDGRIHVGLVVTRMAGSVLVVPLAEELFWRSFLMRWLERSDFLRVEPGKVGWKALAISSAVFALEHRLWFAGLLAGLAYGDLYRRTGDLRVAVLAHALTNGLLGAYVLATGSWGFW
jgi:CAAX prenyl protease-like protein